MKEKATFLSYISLEKRLRKEQLKKSKAAKSSDAHVLEKSSPLEGRVAIQTSSN